MPGIFAPSSTTPTTGSSAGIFAQATPTPTVAPATPIATPEQDAAAKGGVFKDIFNAPADSLLGVIKNTITGIPKAANQIFNPVTGELGRELETPVQTDIGALPGSTIKDNSALGVGINTGLGVASALTKESLQGIMRDTVGGTVAQIPAAVSGKSNFVPNDPVSKLLYGTAPVPNMYENSKQELIQRGVGPKTASMMAIPFGMMSAATDIGMGEDENPIQRIANTDDPAVIEKTITDNYPALKEQAPILSKTLSDVKDTSVVSQTLRDAINQKAADALAAHPANPDISYEPTASKEKETEPVIQTEAPKEPVAPAKTPVNIPNEFKALADEAQKHPDAHSFLTAATKSPELMDELHTLRTNPIEGNIKDPAAFFKAATEEKPEIDESTRLQDEARERSLKNIDQMELDQKDAEVGVKGFHTPADAVERDLGKGTWESMVKGFSKNLPDKHKADILDMFRTPEYVLEDLGLQKGAEMLQDAKDTYMANKKTEIARIKSWKDSIPTDRPESSERIFDYLDGNARTAKPEMSDKEVAVAREIKTYLSQWADRLGLPADARVSNYITHLFDPGSEKAGESIFDDPELHNIMKDNVAKSVYDPFLQKRMNMPNYKRDVWGALDAYAKRATRKEAFDPALDSLSKMAAKLDDQSYKYVAKLSHNINLRPADIDTMVDNLIKNSPVGKRLGDRPVAVITGKIRAVFNRALNGFNIDTGIRTLSQAANTYAKLGEKYTVVGYSDLIKNALSRNMGELHEQGIFNEDFVQDRKVGVYKSLLQKIEPALYSIIDTADKINRGSAYFGAKAKALDKGLSEAESIKYAKRMVRETQFNFGAVDTPTIMSGDIMKTLLQREGYNAKQIEFLARMAQQKDFVGLIRFAAASTAFIYTIGKVFGMSISEVLPALTLGFSPTFNLIQHGYQALPFNDQQTQQEGRAGLMSDVESDFIPAGAQLKKTITGISDVAKGKVTNASGGVEAEIPQTAGNYIKAAMSGPAALPEVSGAKDKINDLYNQIDAGKTGSATKEAYTTYQKLQQTYQSQGAAAANTAFQQIQKTDPAQAKLILSMIDDNKKGITQDEILMKQLGVSNGARAKYIANELNSLSGGNAAKKALWEKYVADKVLTPEVEQQVLPLLKH